MFKVVFNGCEIARCKSFLDADMIAREKKSRYGDRFLITIESDNGYVIRSYWKSLNMKTIQETDIQILFALYDLLSSKGGIVTRKDLIKKTGLNRSVLSRRVNNRYLLGMKQIEELKNEKCK